MSSKARIHKKASTMAKKSNPSRIMKFQDVASRPGKLTSQALTHLLGDDAPMTIMRLQHALSALADAPNALLIELLKDFTGDGTVSAAVVKEALAHRNYVPVHCLPHLTSTSTVRVVYKMFFSMCEMPSFD